MGLWRKGANVFFSVQLREWQRQMKEGAEGNIGRSWSRIGVSSASFGR